MKKLYISIQFIIIVLFSNLVNSNENINNTINIIELSTNSIFKLYKYAFIENNKDDQLLALINIINIYESDIYQNNSLDIIPDFDIALSYGRLYLLYEEMGNFIKADHNYHKSIQILKNRANKEISKKELKNIIERMNKNYLSPGK